MKNTENFFRLHPADINLVAQQVVFLLKEKCILDDNSAEDLLTINQAAKELKVTYQTIYRWIRNKKMNAIVVGTRAKRIKRYEIEQLKQFTFCSDANIRSVSSKCLNVNQKPGDRSWK